MSNIAQTAPRPRLRTTGGIVIGQGHSIPGKMPMAIADEDPRPRGASTIYSYTGHQISGFPRSAGSGLRKVGPMVAPVTKIMAPMWTGSLPAEGCQFWLFETYQANFIATPDGFFDYYYDGTITPRGSPYITTLPIDNEDYPGDEGEWDEQTTHISTAAWLLSIVYGFEGKYYLADIGCPRDGWTWLSNPVPVWPGDYVTEYPI